MVPLLSTKLHRPTLPRKSVARPALMEKLQAGFSAGRPLTLVSAPAGFGKTTCICEWLDSLALPVAWLSLDADENDPGRFFTYLIAALQNVENSLGHELGAVLRSGQLPPAEILSTALVNAILPYSGRFLLVLDDFHRIQEPFILQVFAKIVTGLFQPHVAQPLHLVLLTREDPPLPLARLRAGNLLTEIREIDLRFTNAETARYLREVMELPLAPADVAALADRTEGWIVGLQLAALSIRGRSDAAAFIANLSGSHRHILRYLIEEVLNQLDAEIERFLLQTSVLEKLTPGLCDAITDRADSADLLERLLAANLFLIPLDEEQRWYRYHHLFADLLRSRQTAKNKAETAELHRRASRWFASAASEQTADRLSYIGEAVKHALAAEDYAAAVALIEQHAHDLLMQWYSIAIQGWIESIPPGWGAQSPKLNLAFAWSNLLRGDFANLAPYMERLGQAFSNPDAPLPAGLQAEWLALQSLLLNAQGMPEESIALAEQALATAPEEERYVRSQADMALAAAYKQSGDLSRSEAAYQRMIRQGQRDGRILSELIGISGLGLLYIEQGRLRACFALASQGIDRAERAGVLPPVVASIYGEVGQIHYHWLQLEQAQNAFRRSVELSALAGFSDAEIYDAVISSRLALLQGDVDAAERDIARAVSRVQSGGVAVVGEEVVAQQVRVLLARNNPGDAEAALRSAMQPGQGFAPGARIEAILPGVDLGSRFSYPLGSLYTSALRILLHRAVWSGERSCVPAAVEFAARLIEALRRRGYSLVLIETLLLRAQFQRLCGEDDLADILEALERAEPEGCISTFVEAGKPVAEALVQFQSRRPSSHSGFVQTILAAVFAQHPSSVSQAQAAGMPEPLTGRELDVLRLVADGLTYEEIAGRLVVSINTVRSHVKAIYRKFGVNNRTAAIAEARRLNFL